MLSNIGSLLDRLQGLLSKGFLLGGVIPFALLFLLNWGLFYYLFPEEYVSYNTKIGPPDQGNSFYWIIVTLILFISSLIIWSVNPLLRQFWEGRFLPKSIIKLFKQENARQLRELLNTKRSMAAELAKYRINYDAYLKQLSDARLHGSTKPPAIIDNALVSNLDVLQVTHDSFTTVSFSDVNAFFLLLEKELKSKPADGYDLDEIHEAFVNLYQQIMVSHEHQYHHFLSDIRQRFPGDIGRVGPTTMANFAQVHRDYGWLRYGIDIELFWIHLLKLVREDTNFYPVLEEAKTQLDVSVAITSVLALTTSLWIPITLWMGSVVQFGLITLLGPVAVIITYRIAVQSYRGFTEVVRSAIDLNRLKLLEHLHISLPENSDEEICKWKELSKLSPKMNYSIKKAAPNSPLPSSNTSFLTRLKQWLSTL